MARLSTTKAKSIFVYSGVLCPLLEDVHRRDRWQNTCTTFHAAQHPFRSSSSNSGCQIASGPGCTQVSQLNSGLRTYWEYVL